MKVYKLQHNVRISNDKGEMYIYKRALNGRPYTLVATDDNGKTGAFGIGEIVVHCLLQSAVDNHDNIETA